MDLNWRHSPDDVEMLVHSMAELRLDVISVKHSLLIIPTMESLCNFITKYRLLHTD